MRMYPGELADNALDEAEALLRGIGGFEEDGTDVNAVDGGGGRKAFPHVPQPNSRTAWGDETGA